MYIALYLVYFLSFCSSDCIGSAFNAKGIMQCPNCRKTEMGNWLYANSPRSSQDANNDEWGHGEEPYDVAHSDMATFVVRELSFWLIFAYSLFFYLHSVFHFIRKGLCPRIILAIFHLSKQKYTIRKYVSTHLMTSILCHKN